MSLTDRVRELKQLLGKLLPRTVSRSRKADEEPCHEACVAQLRRHRPRKRSASRVPDSLLVLTARSIARDVHSFDISQLPPDLAQLVFSELLCSSTIDEATFRIFGKQNVYEFDCSEQSSVTDSWLGHFGGCPLHRVSLASCVQITDAGLRHLAPHFRLTHLDLSYCLQLTDDGLDHIRGLTNLRALSLEGCEELRQVSALASMHKLRTLNLMRCTAITGLHHLAGELLHLRLWLSMRQLETVHLGWCTSVTDADVRALARLPSLRKLDLARTLVSDTGVFALQALKGLQQLTMAGCAGVGNGAVGALGALTSLRHLDLRWCTFGDKGVVHLSALTNLETLSMAYSLAGDPSMAIMAELTQLQHLDLDSCPITNAGLQSISVLTNLRHLNLSDTATTDHGMCCLARMKRLKYLNLSHSGVGDLGLAAIAHLTSLEELCMDSRLFTDQGLKAVAPLTRLRALDVFGACISDAGCVHLRPFRRLERLDCCGNGVGDEGVKELIWLQSLRHLCLGQNPRISDKSMLFLSGLGQLRTLNLTGTALTNNGILPLRALTNLETLTLKRTRVKQSAAERLRPLLPNLHSLNC